MTSCIRSVAATKEGLTRFVKPESPCYYSAAIDDEILFPFKYSNGVLDINYDGNDFKATMVDSTNQSPNSETGPAYRIIGGPRLVTSLGPNFKAYIRAWRDGSIDAGSPIEVYIPSQVIRVQQSDYRNVSANSGDSYLISDVPPDSDNYIAGNTTNMYNTTYAFKTPLTFTILEGGVKRYITFRTAFDQE